jgi:hypothetical protein
MAPQLTDADIEALISCLKHSSSKLSPNYDEVAKDLGVKDGKAAYGIILSLPSHFVVRISLHPRLTSADSVVLGRYMRYWAMMRKLGLTGSKAGPQKASPQKGKRKGATTVDSDANGDGNVVANGNGIGNGEASGTRKKRPAEAMDGDMDEDNAANGENAAGKKLKTEV